MSDRQSNETGNKSSVIKELEKEIILDAIKITKNEVSSCYDLVMKTKKLISLYESMD